MQKPKHKSKTILLSIYLKMETKELAKELAPIISETVKEEMVESQKSINEKMESMETEIKELTLNSKKTASNGDEKETMLKSIIVNTFKQVQKMGVSSEAQFKEVFNAQIKETYQNTETATDGAEFVFEQFSKDVYAIFEKFDLVNELNQLNIT